VATPIAPSSAPKCEQQVAQESAESDHNDAERGSENGGASNALSASLNTCGSEHAPCDAVLEQPAGARTRASLEPTMRRSNAVTS
jgi:hypothetical protein